MKLFYTILALCCLPMLTFAQHPTCGPDRYTTELFPNLDTTQAVYYGNNNTYSGSNQNLYMDVYEPNGDTASMRPVIMLAFGGSFIGGAREDMDGLCRYYAKRGFVAVTIDYRIYDGPLFPIPNATTMTDVVVKAASDMKAAVRYLREDAANGNTFRIDSNFIFVGGISAGAILASHHAYLDSNDVVDNDILLAINNNGGWNGNSSSNYQYSSQAQAVINFSGALKSASYIDSNGPPLYSVHDDQDGTVPYGAGFASIFTIPIIAVEGSSLMNAQTDLLGIKNHLITIPNSTGHVSYFGTSSWRDSVEGYSCVFLKDILCSANTSIADQEFPEDEINVYPNPSEGRFSIEIESLPSSYTLNIFDQLGRLVHQENNVSAFIYDLNLDRLDNGMYHLILEFEDRRYQPVHKKLIKH